MNTPVMQAFSSSHGKIEEAQKLRVGDMQAGSYLGVCAAWKTIHSGYWKMMLDVSKCSLQVGIAHQTRGEPQLLRLIHREKHGKERLQRLEDLLKDLREKADLMTRELQEVDAMVALNIVKLFSSVFVHL